MTCIARGLVDRVARKAPKEMDVDQGKRRSKMTHLPTPYQCCSSSVPQLLFVHPLSAVYDRDDSNVRVLFTYMCMGIAIGMVYVYVTK